MLEIQLKIKSFDPNYLNKCVSLIKNIVNTLEIKEYSEVFLPNKFRKLTVIRSPHIDKKSREQFQSVTHQRSINLVIDNYKVGKLFLNMCKELHVIGVQMKISLFYNSSL